MDSTKKIKNMRVMEEGKDKVTIPAVTARDQEGRKRIEKVSKVKANDEDKIKYIEKKLWNKGVKRLERHPGDGLGLAHGPPKSGHGGKYTWEGPGDIADNELSMIPPAIDEKDPNYVDEEKEKGIVKGEESEVAGLVVGEVEVAKAAEVKEGVARIDVDPYLKIV